MVSQAQYFMYSLIVINIKRPEDVCFVDIIFEHKQNVPTVLIKYYITLL